jgi:hypothetical protein
MVCVRTANLLPVTTAYGSGRVLHVRLNVRLSVHGLKKTGAAHPTLLLPGKRLRPRTRILVQWSETI